MTYGLEQFSSSTKKNGNQVVTVVSLRLWSAVRADVCREAGVIVHNVPPKICPPGRFALVYNVPPDILH